MYAHIECEWNLEIYVWLLYIDLRTCHKCLANILDWSWYLHKLDPIYLFIFIFYVKKLLKCQSLKGERAEKVLLRKWVRLGKGGAICMMPKPKAYSSKKYQNFHGINAQKLSCID